MAGWAYHYANFLGANIVFKKIPGKEQQQNLGIGCLC